MAIFTSAQLVVLGDQRQAHCEGRQCSCSPQRRPGASPEEGMVFPLASLFGKIIELACPGCVCTRGTHTGLSGATCSSFCSADHSRNALVWFCCFLDFKGLAKPPPQLSSPKERFQLSLAADETRSGTPCCSERRDVISASCERSWHDLRRRGACPAAAPSQGPCGQC